MSQKGKISQGLFNFSSRASALVSRFSLARVLLSLSLKKKKKRDCSQFMKNHFGSEGLKISCIR